MLVVQTMMMAKTGDCVWNGINVCGMAFKVKENLRILIADLGATLP